MNMLLPAIVFLSSALKVSSEGKAAAKELHKWNDTRIHSEYGDSRRIAEIEYLRLSAKVEIKEMQMSILITFSLVSFVLGFPIIIAWLKSQ